MISLLAACADAPQESPQPGDCPEAVVTDIDETLTTDDDEYMAQILDPSYDPAMRPDADTLMSDYGDLGYTVFFLTARGDDLTLSDGRTAREATEDWLDDHGFDAPAERVYLADGIGALGDDATTYKAGVLEDLQGAGWTFVEAYGNATTDMDGYAAAQLDPAHTWLVGELAPDAGDWGVNPLTDEEAYTAHLPYAEEGYPEACASSTR